MKLTTIRLPDDLHSRITDKAQEDLRSANTIMLLALNLGLNELDKRGKAIGQWRDAERARQ